MKLEDINQKLTERPGGFGGIIKSKLKQQVPFARGTQRKGKAEEALLKAARKVKAALNDWKNTAFRSSGGESAPITMNQFLGWVKKSAPKYAKGIEAYARGDKAYASFFTQKIDAKGKQSSTASDDKVKRRDSDGEQADTSKKKKRKLTPDEQAGYDKINKDAEEEAAEFEKQDLKASKGEDEEPKSDTSASIYEARLRAILEAEGDPDPDVDIGVDSDDVLKDNQIDTLITMGIEKQHELDGGESVVDDASEVQGGSSAGGSSKGAEPSSSPSSIDDNDIGRLKEMLDDLGTDIFDAIRKQDGIEQDVKKQLASRIQNLVDDIALDSF